jgi:hypothetical protein
MALDVRAFQADLPQLIRLRISVIISVQIATFLNMPSPQASHRCILNIHFTIIFIYFVDI